MSKTALIDKASQDVAIVPQVKETAIIALDKTSKAASTALRDAKTDIQRAMATSYGLQKILKALTPEMCSDLCQLQGTKLGFRTDKDTSGGYKPEEVRHVIAEALIRGLRLVGNEINIIAGNLYVTKEGFERLLHDLEGMTDLKVNVGVPASAGDDGCLVPARAAWNLNGVADELLCENIDSGDYRIPVRKNKAMGIDAVQGKARSKLLRRVYERATGSQLSSDADADDVNTLEGSATPVA